MVIRTSSLKLITAAAQVDYCRRHQVSSRLRALVVPLTLRAAMWFIASAMLLGIGMLRQHGGVAVLASIAGAVALDWSIVLISFVIAFIVAGPRSRGSANRRVR